MNAPLRRVAIACLVMFLALMININYLQAIKADELRKDPHNSRMLIQQYQHERGPIVVGGTPVAYSTATQGVYKYKRVYRDGPVYAPATGYYSLYGATGIEKAENDLLDGSASQLLVRRFLDLVSGKQPKGATVILTLNPKAQQAAWDGFRRNGLRGAAVALDPKTGKILAMVSSPSYDPGIFSSFDGDQLNRASKKLSTDPAQPLLNRAIDQTYPPGSTFKVVVSAAALAEGYTPDSQLEAPNRYLLPQTQTYLQNFGGETCGDGRTDTFRHALTISCNTSFAILGVKLGADRLQRQAEQFGLNDPGLTVPLGVARSNFPQGIDKAQTALSSIGQYEVRLTPLQGAMIAAAVANRGTLMKPYLVDQVRAPDTSVIVQGHPEEYRKATSPQIAAQLTDMMQQVVNEGTGTAAQIPGVAVAGKTGTAENAKGRAPHAWFIGFAPANDPQVAVAVVVEGGGRLDSEGTGGEKAAPIARTVMEAVLGR